MTRPAAGMASPLWMPRSPSRWCGAAQQVTEPGGDDQVVLLLDHAARALRPRVHRATVTGVDHDHRVGEVEPGTDLPPAVPAASRGLRSVGSHISLVTRGEDPGPTPVVALAEPGQHHPFADGGNRLTTPLAGRSSAPPLAITTVPSPEKPDSPPGRRRRWRRIGSVGDRPGRPGGSRRRVVVGGPVAATVDARKRCDRLRGGPAGAPVFDRRRPSAEAARSSTGGYPTEQPSPWLPARSSAIRCSRPKYGIAAVGFTAGRARRMRMCRWEFAPRGTGREASARYRRRRW